MDIIKKYFENFSIEQFKKLEMLYSLYKDWNTKINLISRKDFDNFYINHVLHSLSILKLFSFVDNTRFLDVGTGGGFPGIPMAICLPNCKFVLSDSIAKKIRVVEDVVEKLELKNVTCFAERTEKINDKFDFITGRAITALPEFVKLIHNKISKKSKNAFPNGILYLKGGEFDIEINSLNLDHEIFNLNEIFGEVFFETKKLVYLY